MGIGIQTVYQLALSAIMVTVLLTGGVLSPRVATAATYYVATTGSDINPGTGSQPFRTITHGVSLLAAGAGDTLYIRGGTYNEPIGYPANVPPSGTSWANAATIAAYPGEIVTLTGGGLNLNFAISYLIMDRIIIDGSSGANGIFIGCDAHHIRFQNGEVIGGGGSNIVMGCGSNFEMLNSKIHGAPENAYGFYWFGSNSLFDGNEVYNNGGYAYHIFLSGSNDVSNNIIRNNRIYGNGLNAGSGAGGIILSSGSNNQAYNNLVHGNSGGIQVDYRCTNCLVSNNTIYGNSAYGIQIGTAAGIGTVIQNNIVYGNGSAIDDLKTGTFQSNNFTSDPMFVNASANDFRLQSTSPAIDAGVTLSAVPTDFNRIARPQGIRYDIGAYEYQVPTIPAPQNLKVNFVAP